MRRAATALAVCCAVFVTSAGACRQQQPDGPLPQPGELATRTFPEGSTRDGVDALYVGRQRPECDELLLLTADGSAHHVSTCRNTDALVTDPASWTDDTTGDYAYRDDRLWVRTVAWDPITEAFELTEWAFRHCDGGLRDIPPDDSFRVPFEYTLVDGTGPPGGGPCPP